MAPEMAGAERYAEADRLVSSGVIRAATATTE